jgi:hypothetical protein
MDIQYIAGFFDGEGSIGIDARKAKHEGGANSYILKVKIAQCVTEESIALLNEIQQEFGGSISKKDNSRKNARWRPAIEWTATTRKALVFLEAIAPYARLKAPEIAVALEFQRRRLPKGKRGDGKIVERDLADKARLSELKRVRIS